MREDYGGYVQGNPFNEYKPRLLLALSVVETLPGIPMCLLMARYPVECLSWIAAAPPWKTGSLVRVL